ncbi:MAG: hypothetical protein GKR89_05040 [Candidatus Latescibacteria bacterium]|nr:hypothetical protein [Candidatus Latescibacterota bacterium]
MKPCPIKALCTGLLLAGQIFIGCGGQDKSPTSLPAREEENSGFVDAQLEQAVRSALQKPTGVLTDTDLGSLTKLEAQGSQLKELTGIERLANLTILDLSDNQIQDIAPLSRLTKLTFLILTGNQIKDISALGALTQLQSLSLDGNNIEDISALLGLSRLAHLELSVNPLDETSLHTTLPALQQREIAVTFQLNPEPGEGPRPQARFSHEETHFLFIGKSHNNNADIFSAQFGLPEQANLSGLAAKYFEATLSPDGTRIAFTSDRDYNNWGNGSHIFVMDVDGDNLQQISDRFKTYQDLAWSPDGTKIAHSESLARIAFFDMATGTRTYLSGDSEGRGLEYEPVWSPDGSRIAFIRSEAGHTADDYRTDLFVVDTDGTNLRRLTNQPGLAAAPAWSPDGNRIAYVNWINSEAPGFRGQLFVVAVDSAQSALVTSGSDPVWSPDGNRIAFERDGDVFITDLEGTYATELTLGAGGLGPVWLNQDQLAFISGRDGTFDIYLTAIGDEEPAKLTGHLADFCGCVFCSNWCQWFGLHIDGRWYGIDGP